MIMKKNKLILLQLFIAFVLVSTSVYAAITTTISLSVSETTVFRGDTVDVTLSLKDVDSSKKIESVSGYINYDSDVIEEITVDSIQKSAENTVTIGNEVLKVEDLTNASINEIPTSTSYVAFNGSPTSGNDSRIVIDFKDGISEDTDLLTIQFKVKEDATIGEVEEAISYSMFVMTAGTEQSEEVTENIKLTVKAVTTNDDNNTNNNVANENTNTNGNTNSNTNKNTNTNTNSNTNKNTNTNTNTNSNTNKNTNTNTNSNSNVNNTTDNTVSSVKIPAAGAKVVIIPAIILVILAYVSYNRYMKYKDI